MLGWDVQGYLADHSGDVSDCSGSNLLTNTSLSVPPVVYFSKYTNLHALLLLLLIIKKALLDVMTDYRFCHSHVTEC